MATIDTHDMLLTDDWEPTDELAIHAALLTVCRRYRRHTRRAASPRGLTKLARSLIRRHSHSPHPTVEVASGTLQFDGMPINGATTGGEILLSQGAFPIIVLHELAHIISNESSHTFAWGTAYGSLLGSEYPRGMKRVSITW